MINIALFNFWWGIINLLFTILHRVLDLYVTKKKKIKIIELYRDRVQTGLEIVASNSQAVIDFYYTILLVYYYKSK